jgi:osmotically-inducible protein OsmY
VNSAAAPTLALPAAPTPPLAAARVVETPYANAPIPDAKLAHAIEEAIARDPVLESQSIHVSVKNGDVAITGSVPTLAATWRVARLVASFRGATSVTNKVVVNTPVRPDADIARDVTDAIKSDPATLSAKVQATVNAETVTLKGTADSRTQRALLIDVASHVRGVQQVIPSVAVLPFSSRGDAELVADVSDRLSDDARLDGSHVAIEVHGRNATLSGVVGSVEQRDAAVEDAWIAGVMNVDAQAVRVDWLENVRARVAARHPLPSDQRIADAVGRWLASDARVGVQLPSVTVEQGVITLAGNVSDFRAKDAANRDAARASGAWRVEDRMTVLPAKRESDATIQRQATRCIFNDIAAPDSRNVQVSTSHATVTLKGIVASQEEKKVIESDAEEVPGVVAVEDDLKVQGYGPEMAAVAPAAIRDATVENMFWDPRVGDSKVAVDVAPNGDVTLSGVVDSWEQARAANGDAIRAGAAHVINSIRVAGASSPSH